MFVSLCGEMGTLMLMVSAMRQISIIFCYSSPVCSCINNIPFFSILLLCSAVTIHTDLDSNEMALFRLLPLVCFILELKSSHCECPLSCV